MPTVNKKVRTTLQNILSVDFFSLRPGERITFEKKQKFSTFIGRAASWILITISVATFINFGGGMMYHKNPQSIMSEIVTADPPFLSLPNNGFFMAFGIQDLRNKSIHYIDETIYIVKMIQRTKVGTNISLNSIPLIRCSLDDVPEKDDLKGYYSRNQINNLYCINNKSSIEASLQSTWDGPLYRNVLINIYPCTNSSDGKGTICKPLDVIQGYLNSANFAMYFTTLAIDPGNYEKPITTYGKQLYTPISFSTLTYIEMLFGHLNFVSDNGFLIEDLNQTQSANYLSNRQVLSFSSNMVVQIDMKLDKVKTLYKRKYDKVQEVLANVGGIIKAFTIIANFFVLPFVNLKFKLNLANSMFNFKSAKKVKEIKKNKVKATTKRVHKYREKKNYMNNVIKSDKEEKGKERLPQQLTLMQQVKNYFNPNSEKININYFQYYIRCCSNEISKIYSQLLNKGLNRIDQVMDISYIMNKLTEIDVLKVLLLDETQRDLFEYIPKPCITLDEEENTKKIDTLHDNLTKNYERRNTEKASLAFEAFYVLSAKQEKTKLDEKLIEMVPKLKKLQSKSPRNFNSLRNSQNSQYSVPKDILKKDQENFSSFHPNFLIKTEPKVKIEMKNEILFEKTHLQK